MLVSFLVLFVKRSGRAKNESAAARATQHFFFHRSREKWKHLFKRSRLKLQERMTVWWCRAKKRIWMPNEIQRRHNRKILNKYKWISEMERWRGRIIYIYKEHRNERMGTSFNESQQQKAKEWEEFYSGKRMKNGNIYIQYFHLLVSVCCGLIKHVFFYFLYSLSCTLFVLEVSVE